MQVPVKGAGGGGGGAKLHFTPEILNTLKPPGSSFTLDNNQHRFMANFDRSHKTLPPQLQQKTFSKSFATSKDWKGSLETVHRWLWEKYMALPGKLQVKCQVQDPGSIPQEVLEAVEAYIEEQLPPLKKYKTPVPQFQRMKPPPS